MIMIYVSAMAYAANRYKLADVRRLNPRRSPLDGGFFIDLGRVSLACRAVFTMRKIRRPVAAQSAGQFDRQQTGANKS